MKKILILLFAFTLLVGCKKQRMKKDIVGCWVYQDNVMKDSPEIGVSAIRFEKNKTCEAFFYNSASIPHYSYDYFGNWKLNSSSSIVVSWNGSYPDGGTFDLIMDEDDVMYIGESKFIKVACGDIMNDDE